MALVKQSRLIFVDSAAGVSANRGIAKILIPSHPFSVGRDDRMQLTLCQLTVRRQFYSVNQTNNTVMNNFSVNHFEAITLAVAGRHGALDHQDQAAMTRLRDAVMALKSNRAFVAATKGGGLNYPKPLEDRISLAAAAIAGV